MSEPITTANGKVVDSISIAKGETIVISIKALNKMEKLWGQNSKQFVPERWLDENGLSMKAKELPGYHHVLSFVDGARMCLGKTFAIAEFKVRVSCFAPRLWFTIFLGGDGSAY